MTAQPRLLGGRYEIGGMIGYGGMAEVHRGSDLRLGRDVAIKMLRTDLARDETFLMRFRREAQNAASLNHPSIVAVYDTGEDTSGGTPVPYIVMEYVEGRTLKEVLSAEGRFSARRACEILADACAALDFSHRHQIIHRDVKPGNVMLSSNGQVKVMDFGIARAMASGQATMTQTSAVIGTAQYLSPEQARGETVDARSDVYATGCVLYELLCGDPPFTGDNPVSVAYQHVREAPTPPSQINPDVPPSVDAIVLHALAKSPLNRYQSAGEMRDDLERAIAGRPVLAAPAMEAASADRTQMLNAEDATRVVPAAQTTAEQPRKKHTGRNVLIGLLVLVVLGAIGAGAWMLGDDVTGPETVAVPKVVGDNVKDARKEIKDEGFGVKVKKKKSDEGDKGEVLRQTPDADSQQPKGKVITLTVVSGPKSATVPDLETIKGCDAMKDELKQAGLKVKCDEESNEKEAGSLIKQEPDAGKKVDPGSVVKVQVSRGDLKDVPKVVSSSEDEACSEIEEAGFTCDTKYVDPGDDQPGRVLKQDPEEGSLKADDTVTIEVGGVRVPDLKDMTLKDAEEQFKADFKIEPEPSEAKPDWVIKSQETKPGEWVKQGETLKVTAEDPLELPGT